jgi:hypothetical protein
MTTFLEVRKNEEENPENDRVLSFSDISPIVIFNPLKPTVKGLV